jgi:hypothetical protein
MDAKPVLQLESKRPALWWQNRFVSFMNELDTKPQDAQKIDDSIVKFFDLLARFDHEDKLKEQSLTVTSQERNSF